jgi:protein SCO1
VNPAVADDIGAHVDALRQGPGAADALVALLPENLPVHAGRTPAEMGRLRGYLLAALAEYGLPDAALPFVVESLEAGDVADEVAGAAIALRGRTLPPPGITASLRRAVDRRAGGATTVSFEAWAPSWPYARPTTAMRELVRTLEHVGRHDPDALEILEGLARDRTHLPSALLEQIKDVLAASDPRPEPAGAGSCCAHETAVPVGVRVPSREVTIEAQDGRTGRLDDYLRGRVTVLTFFYTRCDNPRKCSLTIRNLAAVRDLLAERDLLGQVRVAAITYDPDFDGPARLERYGRERGVVFGPDARFFRVTAGFTALRERLELGVNYGASTVNRHQVEIYVLDGRGAVAASFTRRRVVPGDVVNAVETALDRGA